MDMLGVDWRKRTKQLEAKEKARRSDFRSSRKQCLPGKAYENWCEEVAENGHGPRAARTWGGKAVGIAPTERLKWRRNMAATADKKKQSVSLSLFMDMDDLGVEEEQCTMATLCWAEGVWMGRWEEQQQKA